MNSTLKRKRKSPSPEERHDMASGGTATLEKPKETKKIIVEFSEDLLERTEAAASELSTDRSKLIRKAVEKFLAQIERRKLERELADAYAANASLALRISEEFSHIDGEDL
jgi:metal-responsive CopG/Arc/MetJ family transcriptional regulator